MEVAVFTFNEFSENTYILYDETKACIIVDPGCNTKEEQDLMVDFIESNGLKPVKLVNTHCHIDHILGNSFVSEKYNLPLIAHRGEIPVLSAGKMTSDMYAIKYDPSPEISIFLEEGEKLTFGETELSVLFTPGHSPASLSFFHLESNQLVAGDVLFDGSIGRTDLPGGDFDTLIANIKNKLFPLGDDVVVYPGHGPSTTIGKEKKFNPFLQ